ncbi:hypothetical protein [Bradyrhizobium manausense]|uniref:hypothetical protein n=1 Tax=Bradyrhizobium manausense TaxID=989370 RepID=UPI0032215F92
MVGGVDGTPADVLGEFFVPACGTDALGGANETGGVAEFCPLARSCDQAPIKMRLRARSKLRLVCIFQMAFVQRLRRSSSRAGKNNSRDMRVKLDGNGSYPNGMSLVALQRLTHVKPMAGCGMAR